LPQVPKLEKDIIYLDDHFDIVPKKEATMVKIVKSNGDVIFGKLDIEGKFIELKDKWVECDYCDGDGLLDDKVCPFCNGLGDLKILEESNA